MSRPLSAGLGLLITLSLVQLQARATPVDALPTPIRSSLKADSIVCSHPESLFLIYEASSIAMAGGGSDTFKSYFSAAGNVFESRSECLVQSQSIEVSVEGYTTMNNPLKPDPVVYGRFGIEGSDNKVWATIGNLPAFEKNALRSGLVKSPTPTPDTPR
ncbi:hypothetical protein QO021_29070 (plasmid) [Pseudomonas amygdali pv. lachrymans]|uniref:hypothetical protein n=1 Tax=Pseudomonas amygdali TaxID=47877 RepID=UPI0006B8B2C9|nr:hypothetical protein [Pseudomonas amygdali]RMM39168.1 hypothetical protein ALQ79_200481 [Pseudomonas amygdali pv. lachrymans]WIO61612.1 hypothetical protein QO021_29070 [Pseudomonas amygdali pv. lachrymans]